jgi:hypothetical protein
VLCLSVHLITGSPGASRRENQGHETDLFAAAQPRDCAIGTKMPYPKEATVKIYNGIDCWRTWFLEECEKANLFGVTEKYLPLINTDNFKPYRIGTLIYLEDAPFFKKTKIHRICGPYQVVESNPQGRHKATRKENAKIIIYKDLHPSTGPWFDKRSVTRITKVSRLFKRQITTAENPNH